MPKKYIKMGSIIVVVVLLVVFLNVNAPANNYKNPNTLKIQDKQSMMLVDKAIEKISNGTSGKFEILYLGGEGQFQWNILNPQETSFFDENGNAVKSILLISTALHDVTPFDQNTNLYQNSTLRQVEIALAEKILSPQEQEAIINTTQPGGEVVKVTSYEYIESELFGDKFFAPTATIMDSSNYGLEDRHYRQEGNYYWLSAASKEDSKQAGYISKCGVFAQLDIGVTHLSARATANLDPRTILFFSAAKDSKISGKIGRCSLQAVAHEQLLSEYRLTLKDSSQILTISNVTNENNTVTFNYEVQGEGNRLSAIILDKKQNEIVYYGQLVDLTISKDGQASIDLSDKYNKNYQIKVFSEQVNGDYKTDFASELVDLMFN